MQAQEIPQEQWSEFFDACIASAVEYLRELWPDELAGVRFEVARVPGGEPAPHGVDRWRVSVPDKRIVLYRLPIERLAHLHRDDEWHRRSFIESSMPSRPLPSMSARPITVPATDLPGYQRRGSRAT